MKFATQKPHTAAMFKLSGAFLIGVLTLAGCEKPVPQDGVDAKVMRFENISNYRYCEVFLIGGNPITKDLSAAFYNTTDRNNGAVTRDSCPEPRRHSR